MGEGLLYPSMKRRMREVFPELGLPMTMRSILPLPWCSVSYAINYKISEFYTQIIPKQIQNFQLPPLL